jgi:hypothetical protein
MKGGQLTGNQEFVADLIRLVPELEPAYREHVVFNEELLLHLFMGDVTRFAIERASGRSNEPVLARLLGYLEERLANGSEEVQELIVVSFVENLQGEVPAILALAPAMGQLLRQQVNVICGPYLSNPIP